MTRTQSPLHSMSLQMVREIEEKSGEGKVVDPFSEIVQVKEKTINHSY